MTYYFFLFIPGLINYTNGMDRSVPSSKCVKDSHHT